MNPIVEKVYQIGIIPVIAFNSVDEALPLCKALSEGGLPAAEVTFRTACAEECIRKIHEEMPEMLLGAGTVLNSELYRASLKISECVSHESSKVIIYIIAIPCSSSASTGKECTSRSGRNPVRIAVAISSSRFTNSNTNRKCRTICRTLKSLLSSIHLSQPGSSLGLNLRCGCVGRCYSGILNYTDHGRNENSSKYADDSDYYYELYVCKALLGLESLKLLYHCKDLL